MFMMELRNIVQLVNFISKVKCTKLFQVGVGDMISKIYCLVGKRSVSIRMLLLALSFINPKCLGVIRKK